MAFSHQGRGEIMKSVLSLSLYLFFFSSVGQSAANLDLNPFFNSISKKGEWSGTGTSIIYKGPKAGTYDIEVELNAIKGQDNSWNVTVTTYNIPPKPTTSNVTYWIDDRDLIVQTSQNSSVANDLVLTPNQLSFYTIRTDNVTGRDITNTRNMKLKNGVLTVNIEIFDDNNDIFQTFDYQLTPKKR